jgi:hypothetical protein
MSVRWACKKELGETRNMRKKNMAKENILYIPKYPSVDLAASVA